MFPIKRKMPTSTFSNKEIIIDGPGTYLTRKGQKVDISEVKDSEASFNCHGHFMKISKKTKKLIHGRWDIWAPN